MISQIICFCVGHSNHNDGPTDTTKTNTLSAKLSNLCCRCFFYMKMDECDRLFHIIAHLPLDLCLSLFTAKMPVEITQILCSSSNYAIWLLLRHCNFRYQQITVLISSIRLDQNSVIHHFIFWFGQPDLELFHLRWEFIWIIEQFQTFGNRIWSIKNSNAK